MCVKGPVPFSDGGRKKAGKAGGSVLGEGKEERGGRGYTATCDSRALASQPP